MARALERARAHHHVAPRRGQAVQQHHRRSLAVELARRAACRPRRRQRAGRLGGLVRRAPPRARAPARPLRSGLLPEEEMPHVVEDLELARPGSARRSGGRSRPAASDPRCRGSRASGISSPADARSCRARRSPASGPSRPAPRPRGCSAIAREALATPRRRRRKRGDTLTSQPARIARARSPDIIASLSFCDHLRAGQRAARARRSRCSRA